VTLYLGKSKISFLAHRVVLGICSPYFDDALTGGFKESEIHEFNVEKESPYALWRVLQFIYTGDYSDESSESLVSEGLFPLRKRGWNWSESGKYGTYRTALQAASAGGHKMIVEMLPEV